MNKGDDETRRHKPSLWRWILLLVLVFALPSSLNYLRDKQIQYIAAITAARPNMTHTPPLAPAITPWKAQPKTAMPPKSAPTIDYENPPLKKHP